jgi:hypothetical protein
MTDGGKKMTKKEWQIKHGFDDDDMDKITELFRVFGKEDLRITDRRSND